MQQKKQKELKITIVGNSQVGKTTFINSLQLSKLKNKQLDKNLDLNSNFINRINVLGEDYRLTLIDIKGSGKHLQKNYDNPQWKILTQKTNIAIIMFDVGNKITFDEIGRYWLNLVQSSIQPKVVVILGNKIDRQMPALTLKSVIHFCESNDLQLFLTSNQMKVNWNQKEKDMMLSHNKKIIEQIILYYESKLLLEQLKLKKQDQIKKPGFLNRFFKLSSKQQQNSKQNQKQRQMNLIKKLVQMKKIQNQIKQKYEQKIKLINDVIQSFISKCETLSKNTTKSSKLSKSNASTNKSSNELTLQQMTKRLENVCYIIQKQIQDISKLQQNIKVKSQQYQKQVKLKNEYEEQKVKLKELCKSLQKKKMIKQKELQQYKQQNKLIHNSKMIELQKQINQRYLNSIIHQYQIADEIIKLKQQLKDKQAQFQSLINKQKLQRQRQAQLHITKINQLSVQLHQYHCKQTFIQNKILSRANHNILSSLSTIITNYHQKITKLQTKSSKIQLKKIYQSDLYDSTNLHTYIEGKQCLLYTLQLSNIIIIIYISDAIKRSRKGKNGIMMLWDRKDSIRQVEINKNIQFWKYDPISLVFGKNQFVVKFWKKIHILWLNQKKFRSGSLFLGNLQGTLELFGLQKNEKSLYPINSIEICQVKFLYGSQDDKD